MAAFEGVFSTKSLVLLIKVLNKSSYSLHVITCQLRPTFDLEMF